MPDDMWIRYLDIMCAASIQVVARASILYCTKDLGIPFHSFLYLSIVCGNFLVDTHPLAQHNMTLNSDADLSSLLELAPKPSEYVNHASLDGKKR